MKKILFLVCLLLCLLLAGCGPQEKNTADSGKVLYTVTDATGTKLSFSEKPQRIVSLNVSADEILLDMVDSKRLAALSLLADDPGICSAGDKVKSVKGRAQGSNLESVLAMQPDLVIIPWSRFRDCAAPDSRFMYAIRRIMCRIFLSLSRKSALP